MPRAVGQLRRMSVCNGMRKMTPANVFMAALLLLPRVNTKTEHASVDGTQHQEDTSLHSPDIFSIPAPDTQDNTINWTDSDKQNLENSTENDIFASPNPGSESAAEVEETADAGIVYQVLGPGRYTALEGPLNVTVLRGSNRKRTFIGPQHSEFLQLSARLLHSSDELGSRTIGPVVEGVHYSTSLPCGLVSVGGTHVIRLSRNDTVLAETIVLVRWPKVVVLPPLNGEPISARLESKCRPLPSERPLQTCGELLHHDSVSSLSPVILPLQHQLLHDGSEIKPSSFNKTNNDSVNGQAIKDMLYDSNEEAPLTLQEKRKLISLSQAEEKPKLFKTASYSLIQSYSEISNNTLHDSMPAETGRKEKAQQQTKFCEPPQVRGTDEDGSGRVVDRVRLTSLYSSGESDLWFDCRHLMDGEVYSARITVQLPASPVLGSSPRFTVQWSTMVSLNVTVRYMQECHGSASVRVGQRTCRSTLNKIRVYARVPFNVDSVNPPVEEKYLAEYRVRRLPVNIPCSLFSEGPSEYCFVYVSVASSGAVFEVARVCRSTLRPGVAMRHGVWSAWSGWSECVPPCGSGQRIRYRYCDSPPPLNKGAYCQGNATAVMACTNPACDLPAVTSTSSPSLPLDPRLRSCNCGCRLNVTSGHSLLLDLDTSSCRGNVSWLIKSPDGESVMAALSRASLLAGGQWVKVRDGNRSTSPLLLTLPTLPRHTPGIFLTTHMLMATTLTGIQEEKRWNKFNSEKNTFDPWWLIRSSSEWLRLEVHTLTNVSNETIIPHLGFTLLARPAGAMWPHHVEEELFVSKDVQAVGWISYASVVNFFALVFIAIILCLIVVFVVAYRFQYRVYRKSKMESDSLSDSFGSSSDLLEQQSSKRLPSLHTLAEVLSLASLSFGRRDTQSNYTQLTDRNCVPLRNKTGFTSMPSSPFCGRAPFMRAKNSRRCETNRRSASCEELESRFIFPIKEENVMTTSISEVEISSSCKEDSGNESPSKESAKKLGKKSLIKKPQTIKGSFAYVTKVKDLNGSRLREKNTSCNSPKIPSHLKLNLKNTGNGRRQSPITVGKISSIATAHASSTSELSMTGADLEFDYYDYNMDNASAVPGSLFGLDPTLMPWLPSILNIDEIDEEDDIYTSTRHPFSVSVSTLTRDDEVKENIPLQNMASLDGREKTTGLAENSDMSASKAISLSSSDNSDEIKFADDSAEE